MSYYIGALGLLILVLVGIYYLREPPAGENVNEVAQGKQTTASDFYVGPGEPIMSPPEAVVDSTTRELHCMLGFLEGNSYWLLPDAQPGWVQVDLGELYPVAKLRWLNTSNGDCRDRGTRHFRIAFSRSGNFTGEEEVVYQGTMAFLDVPQYEEYSLSNPIETRYVRYYVEDYYGAGGGLNELEVYALARSER